MFGYPQPLVDQQWFHPDDNDPAQVHPLKTHEKDLEDELLNDLHHGELHLGTCGRLEVGHSMQFHLLQDWNVHLASRFHLEENRNGTDLLHLMNGEGRKVDRSKSHFDAEEEKEEWRVGLLRMVVLFEVNDRPGPLRMNMEGTR